MKPLTNLIPNSVAAYWLRQFANEIWIELSRYNRTLRLVKPKSFDPEPSDTGGILVEVATAFSGNKWVSLQLWLDQYLKPGESVLSYCYYFQRKGYETLFDRSLSGSIVRLRGTMRRDVGFSHLRRFKGGDIQKVYTERSYYGYYFAGKFVRDSLPTRFTGAPGKALIREAVEFFSLTLSPKEKMVVEKAIDTRVTLDEFVGIEGKERVKIDAHIEIERRSRVLADKAKLRDKHICQVCEFNFAASYPGIGEGFAEAHHKKPLASLQEKAENRPKDLITVCANCHRMLHRRKGMTVKKLQQIVRKGRSVKRQSG